jgi:hypothetical protein
MNTAMQTMMPMPMMPMMGGMNPMMMNPMMAGMPMMGMMNGMPGMAMPMMMCKMTCTMAPNGVMTCEMAPMDPAMKDAFMQCCQTMMTVMGNGMPMMMNCGGMMMMGLMPAKA